MAIRYARTLDDSARGFTGKWNIVKPANGAAKIIVLAVGKRMLDNALQVVNSDVEVVDVTTVKPLDSEYLDNLPEFSKVLTLEENVIRGGFGESVLAYLSQRGRTNSVRIMGVADDFVSHATVDQQLAACGLDSVGIQSTICDLMH